MKTIRAGIKDREDKNKKILKQLLSSEFYSRSRNILSYYSVGSEVETGALHELSYGFGKKIALPVTDEECRMRFYFFDSEALIKKGLMGIPEPYGSEEADPESFDLCIIPALACDTDGFRMGYGKGCYDRFLRGYSGVKAVLVYSDCLTDTVYPDEWDIKVDYAVCDRGIIKF